jgi:SMC interacting uncharacterized protein involved in chromosome segregation
MIYTDKLRQSIKNVEEELKKSTEELDNLEKELANVKLNPYGITSIDFAKRQELSRDCVKMEGAIMGLTLALETFEESQGVTL